MSSGHYGLAEELISDLIKIDQTNARYRDIYANLLAFRNKFKKALVHSKAAAQLEPDDAQYHNNLGVTYALMGDSKNAKKSLEKALDLDPSAAIVTINLSESLYNLGHQEEAYELINSFIAKFPDDPVPHEKLIQFSSSEGNKADVLRHFVKFIEIKFDKNFINDSQPFLKVASNFLLNFKTTIQSRIFNSPFEEEYIKEVLIGLIDELSKEEENKRSYKKMMSKYKESIPTELFEKINELSGSIDLGFVTRSDYEVSDHGTE